MTGPEEAPGGRRGSQTLAALFSLDTRALGIFRIALGLILVSECLFIEIPALLAGAADFPPSRAPRDGFYGVLLQWNAVLVLPPAAMLLAGLRARSAALLCWAVYSVRVRHEILTARVDLGNYVLLLLLFWGMLLPLGARFSLDALRARARNPAAAPPPRRVLSIASAGLLIQLFLIYFSAGITKHMPEWVLEASALRTVLLNERFATPLGAYAARFPAPLAVLSVATVILEVVGPVLLFIPGKRLDLRRGIVAASFLLFHAGMALLMRLNLFPWVCMSAWLLYLPSSLWDRCARREGESGDVAAVAFDPSRLRSGIAGAAIAYAVVSTLVTLFFYPVREGMLHEYQTVGKYLGIYQQWAMFSMPSSL
jgi:hypothetical protein